MSLSGHMHQPPLRNADLDKDGVEGQYLTAIVAPVMFAPDGGT